ncbi:DnaJ domain-containing protein [Micromonospora sp. NPDC005367]|uniref:J domain-containing protein n=1 Tax=Micromonospora sp. NPDC005367 TaxID=3155590 RepID=UPI0033A34DF5
MFPDGQDPYALVGVTRDSSVAEIRERYLVLVQIWHPDKHQSSSAKVRAEVTRQMQRINAAYKELTDAHERAARERQDRERQGRERQDRERQARERENRERDTHQRRDRERETRERQDRERETREREHARARWTHPRFTSASPPSAVHPIAISLRSGERGYTLRAYLDDQRTDAVFLGAQNRLLLFRSAESMRTYAARTEAHELAGMPSWADFVDQLGGAAAEPDDEHCFDLDLILYSLRYPPVQWVPALFIANRDFIREVAEAFDLGDVLKLLTVGSPLDHLDDLFRIADRPIAGWSARRQLASVDSGLVSSAWRKAIRGIEEHVRWLR